MEGGLRLLQNHTKPLFLSQREGSCTQGIEVALGTGSTMTDTLQSHMPDAGWGIREVEDRNDPRMSPVQPLAQRRNGLSWKGFQRIAEPSWPAHHWKILLWGCLAVAKDGDQTPCPHGYPSQTQ